MKPPEGWVCGRDSGHMGPCAARRVEKEMTEDERGLRRLLWLRHGCKFASLYGDDGEMQCSGCGIDFKRMTAVQIDRVLSRGVTT